MKDAFNEQWDNVLSQAVQHFAISIKEMLEVSPDHYDENPQEWLNLGSAHEMYDYITGSEYWHFEWSKFLLAMLVYRIYGKSPFKFNK